MITNITPTASEEVPTTVVQLRARVSGWTPKLVEFLIGNGRLPIIATYNATTDLWQASMDTAVPMNGAAGGQEPISVWNFAAVLRVRASGIKMEESSPHWFFVMKKAFTAPNSYAWRSALAFGPAPIASGVTAVGNYYDASYGKPLTTVTDDPVLGAARKVMRFRPDPAGDLSNQAATGLRVQYQTIKNIVAGDELFVGMSFYFPTDFPALIGQDKHLNVFQVFGPDSYGTGAQGEPVDPTYNNYNGFGSALVLNFNPSRRYTPQMISTFEDIVYSEVDVLKSGGNSQNAGLLRPFVYQKITRGKWYDVVLQIRVSNDPRAGWVKAYMNDGSGLKPVLQPIAYPGTNDYTKVPYVLTTPWHSPQRTDIQCYGNPPEGADPGPFPLSIYAAGHKIGPTLESVDPGSYASTSYSAWAVDRTVPVKYKRTAENIMNLSN